MEWWYRLSTGEKFIFEENVWVHYTECRPKNGDVIMMTIDKGSLLFSIGE